MKPHINMLGSIMESGVFIECNTCLIVIVDNTRLEEWITKLGDDPLMPQEFFNCWGCNNIFYFYWRECLNCLLAVLSRNEVQGIKLEYVT